MDTIFMNSKNSEASDPHKILLSLLEIPDGSYSVFDTQDILNIYLKTRRKD